MELRDIGYFQALAAELNFGRAAQVLHMTQPALSVAIARLERQVGCPLFERTHHGVLLTPAGAVLMVETASVLPAVERASALARRASQGELGILVVGFIDAAVFDPLPDVVDAFRTRYPDIDLTLRQRPSAELIDGVEKGTYDVAFVRPEARAGVTTRMVCSEPAIVALSKNHPLGNRPFLYLSEITEQPFVFPESRVAPEIRKSWLDTCAQAGFNPRIVAEVNSAQILVELIAWGIGIGFASESWVRKDRRVVARPLRPGGIVLEMAVAYRPDRMSRPCENFVKLALREYRSRIDSM